MSKKRRKEKDIKYLGVPNVCFSLTDKDDDREPDFRKQRIKYGFDDSETWSLRDTIGNFIIPRLERYLEIMDDIGENEYSKQHIKDAKKFLKAMKLVTRDNGVCLFSDEEKKQLEKGLRKFPDIFMGLWW